MKTLAFLMILATAGGAFADEQPKSTTVGGGVNNPWRSPYKTALVSSREGREGRVENRVENRGENRVEMSADRVEK